MNVKHLIKNWYIGNHREKFPPLSLLDAKYVGRILAWKTKLIQTKVLMPMIDRFSKMEGVYKVRERWYLTYMKLLWEKVGDKHLINDFGGGNRNAEMSCKTLYNNMALSESFEATSNGTVV